MKPTVIIAIFFIYLSTAFAQEDGDKPEQQQQQGSSFSNATDTQFGSGNIMESLFKQPDTSIDTSKINAAQQQLNFNEAVRADQVEGIVRQEQKNPNLQNDRNLGSNENATGMMRKEGKVRDLESLTDAETVLSQEYVHKGLTDRIYRAECAGDNLSICEGQEKFGDKTFGVDPAMMGMLAKGYAVIVGFTAGDFKKAVKAPKGDAAVVKPAAEGAQATEATGKAADADKADDDKVSDYCRYIPMGVEMMAFMKQNMAQDNIMQMSSSSGTAQKDSLLKAAKSHDERAKQAKIQFAGWGATAACYTAYGFMGIQRDKMYFVKLAGSVLFTAYYNAEIGRHEGYAKTVKGIADKIPGKGDCNPVTDTLCYCSEESTKNDLDFCLPQIRNRHINKLAEFNTPCINDKGQTDLACKCLDEDRCFDKKLESNLVGLGFTPLDMKGIRPAQELARGSLSSGSLNTARQTNAAINNRLKRDLGTELNKAASQLNLTAEQQSDANKITALGVPSPLARMLSASPMTDGARERLAEMKAGANSARATAYKAPLRSNQALRRSGGSGLSNKQAEESNDNQFSDIFNKLNKGDNKREAASDNVLIFAERAEQQAQISRSQDKFLFDIISNRYRLSAWNRFEFDQTPTE